MQGKQQPLDTGQMFGPHLPSYHRDLTRLLAAIPVCPVLLEHAHSVPIVASSGPQNAMHENTVPGLSFTPLQGIRQFRNCLYL